MKSILIVIIFSFLCASFTFAQEEETYEKYLLTYNEVNNKGVEEDITAFGWFIELPYVPVYTYFDRDAGKKVTIRTNVNPYQNEDLADLMSVIIVGAKYGIIKGACKNSDKEFEILDLTKLHPDFIGLSLAIEIKLDPINNVYIFESYPFEDDFPFKFAEDVVYTKFTIEFLEGHCQN